MGKTSISPSQLFALIMLFEFGTALVVPIGLEAQQSVWLSILVAMIGGILLYLVFDCLYREYPTLILSGYMRNILGKYLGWPLSLMYIPFFIYSASRVLRDAGDLLVTSLYDQTPLLVIVALMIFASVYVLYKGIEVLSRLAEIYLILMLSLGVVSNAAILFSGIVDFKNLLPLLKGGWMNIFHSAQHILLFPFSELICFTTILPHLKQYRNRLVRKTGVTAILITGILLSLTHALEISVLGIDMYSRTTFPLFTTIGMVNIADFIQRLDALVMLTLIIGVFFKMTIFSYAAIAVTADLFKVKEQRKLSLPIGIVILFTSILMAGSLSDHIEEGAVNLVYNLNLFCIVIPLLLVMVHFIRKQFGLYK